MLPRYLTTTFHFKEERVKELVDTEAEKEGRQRKISVKRRINSHKNKEDIVKRKTTFFADGITRSTESVI